MAGWCPPFASGWTADLHHEPAHRRAIESLACTTSGGVGLRAVSETWDGRPAGAADEPVRIAGWYGPEPPGDLLTLRGWLPRIEGVPTRWRVDLRHGVVEHEIAGTDAMPVRTLRYGSLTRPGVHVHCGPATAVPSPPPVATAGAGRTAAVEIVDLVEGDIRTRIAAVALDADPRRAARLAARRVHDAAAHGSTGLLREQTAAWDARWQGVEVAIEGDASDELALRFGLHHLLAHATPVGGELPIGARGVTGHGYHGHVFWDAEVFVLPVYSAVAPAAAAAMLTYRHRRLAAADERARREGRAGARFPWESAATGVDVTPASVAGPDGEPVAILTGERELHIGSDIAWAACHHAEWTGAPLSAEGRTLVVETARYLDERLTFDAAGNAHLRHVIGPDEYHEDVDDNAFTNTLLRWHLGRAAALTNRADEAARWRSRADAIVSGYRPELGRHEQFAGFDDLEPLLVSRVVDPPVAADLLLGAERVARSQVVKQADVVMLHHVLPREVPAGSLEHDLRHYLPRTAHGSSLSPAIHAAALARVGRTDEALVLLRLALRLDLDDLTGTTGGGLHLAAMGGTWQAVAFGFLGLGIDRGALCLDPRLPTAWQEVRLRCTVLGRLIELRAGHDEVVLEADGPLPVRWDGGSTTTDHLRLVGSPGRRRWAP